MEKNQKNQKSQVTENVSYDDRRKELTHKTKEVKETEVGELVLTSQAVLHEEGIRKTIKNLQETSQNLKKRINILKERLGPTPKMTPELQKLKDQLTILQKINHDEVVTPEDKKKEEADLLQDETTLKKVEKDLKEIKDAIGTRLKL